MARSELPDEFWQEIEPLLPPDTLPGEQGGRPRIPNKTAMRGIFYILTTGIRWEDIPREIGCSGMTCWRRLRDWQKLSLWDQLHRLILAQLRKAEKIDLSLVVVDSTISRTVGGGEQTGPNPTDRRKPGTKQHLIVDRNGIPLEIRVTGANRHDVREIIPLVINIPAIGGKPGAPIHKPKVVQADRAYHDQWVDALLYWMGIIPRIAKRNTPHGSGLGKTRFVVERTISWIRGLRRLRVRFDRHDYIYQAWNSLAMAFICWRTLIE
ncbi:IS5 family transposase [Telmatocola sphagniphila]|uniref:IS5 family transposase n=1 Tax=Telmatocola sphagniphila TaxID=1123043 RepID=A0A8E6B5E6_9BACT|nr:IS5 family transposase [Telmatocola sphagniphila]QVL31667.1 IS5 family transposase [Telmatocola sphagniphila]